MMVETPKNDVWIDPQLLRDCFYINGNEYLRFPPFVSAIEASEIRVVVIIDSLKDLQIRRWLLHLASWSQRRFGPLSCPATVLRSVREHPIRVVTRLLRAVFDVPSMYRSSRSTTARIPFSQG